MLRPAGFVVKIKYWDW